LENGKPLLEPALRARTAHAEHQLGEHPSPETLAAYHEGRLVGEEGDRLRDHLALCADCAQLLLDFAAFPEIEVPAGTRKPTEGEVDEAWQAMQGRLGETGTATPNVVRMPQASPVSRPRPAYWAWALAASWIAVVGLGVWVFELRKENARLAQPAVDAVIADLTAGGDSTRGEPQGPKALPSGSRLLLILDAPGMPPHAGYEADLVSAEGAVLWTGKNLPRGADGSFTLDLPPGFLHPGKYQIRLYGVDDGKRQTLADFPLRIGAP
jgi:hypothetical protein